MSFGDWRKDRRAVRAGQDADGAWFAATDLLNTLWPPKTRIAEIHPGVVTTVLLTPFIEVRTDDLQRVGSGACCTVDVFSLLDASMGHLEDEMNNDFRWDAAQVNSTVLALRSAWGSMHFEPPDEDIVFPLPEEMPPISHYRFVVNDRAPRQGPANPYVGRGRVGWTRLAAEWGIYALRALAASGGGHGSSYKAGYGEIRYMGGEDFYTVAEHFRYIGDQDT